MPITILTPREVGEQRRAQKISQQRMAELLGISRSSYVKAEASEDMLYSRLVKATEILSATS